jgi:hypothetical protein
MSEALSDSSPSFSVEQRMFLRNIQEALLTIRHSLEELDTLLASLEEPDFEDF